MKGSELGLLVVAAILTFPWAVLMLIACAIDHVIGNDPTDTKR